MAAANDNALARIAGEIRHTALGWRHGAAVDELVGGIAGEIRHTALGWRHGAAVDELVGGRAAVMAEYGEHREQIRAGDNTAALGAAFGNTLTRLAALIKIAEPFRARARDL